MNAGVRDGADLFAVEVVPTPSIELAEKTDDGPEVNEVHEGIADVALVLKVNGQVEEVVEPLEVLIDFFKDRGLGVLVGDVPHHQRRPAVRTLHHAVNVQGKL